ncbi:SusC/RagA family TonB-linked outer membrane protein [Chitinophaga sp. SYP-B3965]|uniref:SusC/RagA family TonB-linked outer membrane protein n=1 Tax=Chitinophaga sp. SYP-B3965 TaxID=2663120 RepID=UPI001564FC49|nr:SusC/RagA family TonB-linked outer membrane protein [Chitinophaga sp. SYP-B3965]
MRLTAFLLIVFCLQVSANKGEAQTVTLSGRDVPLAQVFAEIKKQTGYLVFYDMDAVKAVAPISVSAKNLPLKAFLIEALKESRLAWAIKNGNVIISQMDQPTAVAPVPVEVTGMVMGTDGIYLPGAVIKVKGTNNGTASDANGKFTITANVGETLVITFIGFQTKEVIIPASRTLRIVLEQYVSKLDEAVVQAYGTTSQRVNTGNIFKVSGKELNEAPVSDVLSAMAGRVPGMVITQNTGVAGSAFKVNIRGRTQIDQTNGASDEPLFIIDGVPMSTGNNKVSMVSSAISGSSATLGLSPFYSVNMADIESIEVLKDADATAIYGSRGANGVIMITTRRAKAGATRFNLRAETGGSRVKLPDLLSTKDYVAMRNEAFRNDNKAMTTANAYDLLLWDTTRDNNLAKQLIGGTASMTNIQASLSGGNNLVQFLVGGGYFKETDVYPGTFPNSKASANFNITSRSADQKFTAIFSGNFTSALNTSTSTDLSGKLNLPPNFQIYDSLGGFLWNEKGVASDNPLAYTLNKYSAKTDNLNASVNLSYNILKGLYIRSNIGYNQVSVEELAITPKTSLNPNTADPTGSARFGNNNFKSWIVEPQIDYNTYIGKGSLNVLGGATYQSQRNNGYSFGIRGYTSDEFLGSLVGIPATGFINPATILNEYKYQAFFGRVTYNYNNKYLVNFSGRRDGSSRFGPDFRFSNFGAVGAAWLFTNEEFMKAYPAISFGKLRGSYGITGNDKIGEYKYIDSYTSNAFYPTYKDSAALTPTSLFKPDLHWEKNLKLEVALELGFLQDRILFTAAWYRNHSSDPLVDYPLPLTTGFSSITANLQGVLLENSGWEFTLNTTNIKSKDFNWTTNFNLSVPKNKLLRFPNLSQTSYASRFIIGQPLNLVFIGKNLGVDPQTGLYNVEDEDKNGTFSATAAGDLQPLFNTDPKFFGGMQNNFSYKGFQLGVFLQFSSQMGRNWLASLASAGFTPIPVGGLQNVPYIALNRWQKPGDVTPYQKFTTNNSIPANSLSGWSAAGSSDVTYSDNSYLRVKTVSLSYDLPNNWLKKIKMNSVRVYAHAQNLFTFAKTKDSDPETTFMFKLPPLRTITAGIQVNI